MRCAVVGAGAWGTALADLLTRNGHDVRLWAYEPDVVESVNKKHENVRFLGGHALKPALKATGDLATRRRRRRAGDTGDSVARVAIDTEIGGEIDAAFRAYRSGEQGHRERDLVPDDRSRRAGDSGSNSRRALRTKLRQGSRDRVSRRPSWSRRRKRVAAEIAQQAFSSPYFRAYTHTDVIGVELGGALKNVMAVATGIAEGLGLGFNARAALVTRGLAEMTRLGLALGAEQSTFAGLAGPGRSCADLHGLAQPQQSGVGVELGKGKTLEEVLRDRETVAEGVVTAQSARELAAREGVEMPIVDTVNRVLFEGQPARSAIAALMTRELRAEVDR